MHIVVLVLGVVAALAGLTAVVFGFSIKEFTLGGTMLIVGTTTLVGGLVMIAVAGATRELNRIAKALMARPMPPPRFPRPGEPFDAYAPGGFRPGMTAPRPPSMPVPPPMPLPQAGSSPPPAREAEEAKHEAEPVPELHEPAAPALQPEDQAAAEVSAERDESDGVPLPSHASTPADEPSRVSAFLPDEAPEAHQSAAEAQQQDAHDEPAGDSDTERSRPREEPLPSGLGRPLPFDAIWPPRGSPGRRFAATELDDAVPRQDPAASAGNGDASAPAAAEPVAEAEASWEPADADIAAQPEQPDSEADDTKAEAPYAVSILKSGVVDGMAYTLYSDGSIEAELPSGTIRFASISELRMHLEQAG